MCARACEAVKHAVRAVIVAGEAEDVSSTGDDLSADNSKMKTYTPKIRSPKLLDAHSCS